MSVPMSKPSINWEELSLVKCLPMSKSFSKKLWSHEVCSGLYLLPVEAHPKASLSLQAPCSAGMEDYQEWKNSKPKASKERQKKARQQERSLEERKDPAEQWKQTGES